jgi:hypothetical protein
MVYGEVTNFAKQLFLFSWQTSVSGGNNRQHFLGYQFIVHHVFEGLIVYGVDYLHF